MDPPIITVCPLGAEWYALLDAQSAKRKIYSLYTMERERQRGIERKSEEGFVCTRAKPRVDH